MNKIEWKKLNYVFSVNCDVKESISNLKLTEESILFVDNFINDFKSNVNSKINGNYISLEDKKRIIEEFFKKVPNGLMILRNHLKNCLYSKTLIDFKYKYEKYVLEDIKRLSYIKHS